MNLQTYLNNKKSLELATPLRRPFCVRCRQAQVVCDCASLKPFDPGIQFVILIHPDEARRRIATGRLTHHMLEGSLMIEGESFEGVASVERLIADSSRRAYVLYPGATSINVSALAELSRREVLSDDRGLTVFVIDGTWRTAKKMLRLSPALGRLPRVSFDLKARSRFQIRKQPADYCLSTLEAVHHLIELLGLSYGFDIATRQHDHMLEVFDAMVARQIDYEVTHRTARETATALG